MIVDDYAKPAASSFDFNESEVVKQIHYWFLFVAAAQQLRTKCQKMDDSGALSLLKPTWAPGVCLSSDPATVAFSQQAVEINK